MTVHEAALATGRARAGVAPVPARRSISVLVPVAEEIRPLAEVYREFAPAVADLAEEFEFVFMLNSWSVGLAEDLDDLREQGAPIRVLEVGPRSGESGMLAAAAPHLNGDIVVILPTYRRVPPESIATLVRRVREGVDLVTAARRMEGGSLFNRIQNRIFHVLLRPAGGGFQDIASGVRAMPRHVLNEVPLYGDSFRFLPLLARNEGFRVEEVEVPLHESTKRLKIYPPGIYIRRLLDILGIFFLVRFTHKPLRFFGLIGTLFALPGAVILLLLFFQRLGGQSIAGRPLLLLGVLLFSLGIQAVGIGLVGEIIVHFSASTRRLYRVRAVEPAEEA